MKLVYQGGHHNVYCDGEKHVTTYGGVHWNRFNKEPFDKEFHLKLSSSKEGNINKCDCHKWGK